MTTRKGAGLYLPDSPVFRVSRRPYRPLTPRQRSLLARRAAQGMPPSLAMQRRVRARLVFSMCRRWRLRPGAPCS